jgi:hypothetical protein
VVAEEPEIAGPGDRLLGELWRFVFSLGSLGSPVSKCQQALEILVIKADEVEIDLLIAEPGELLGQDLLVPARLEAMSRSLLK